MSTERSLLPGAAWTPRWREYAIEAWALGTFMLSACSFGVLLFHPSSPAVARIPSGAARAWLMGGAMGVTLIALVYSPWGRRSGAQMNPAFTLAFLGLGRIAPRDALGYICAQFVGGAAGVWLAVQLLGGALGAPSVNYVVTAPGPAGVAWAFAGEFVVSALQMALVLHVASSPRWSRYTGACAAVALATFVALESPLSGMSMNPARTVASSLAAGEWQATWLYFVAPLLGMSVAAFAFARGRAQGAIPCGKLMHAEPCLFCEHVRRTTARGAPADRAPDRSHPPHAA